MFSLVFLYLRGEKNTKHDIKRLFPQDIQRLSLGKLPRDGCAGSPAGWRGGMVP